MIKGNIADVRIQSSNFCKRYPVLPSSIPATQAIKANPKMTV